MAKNIKYWLLKSEGDCYSIHDLKRDSNNGKSVSWSGIRNFQARNYMRDEMNVGDLALFYHSSSTDKNKPNGIYGIAKVTSKAHIDETAIDIKDEHYDEKAVKYMKGGKDPLWVCVDVTFVREFSEPLTLTDIKSNKKLNTMLVTQKGQRLSVLPVEEKHFNEIVEMMK